MFVTVKNRNVPVTAKTQSEIEKLAGLVAKAIEMCDGVGVPYGTITEFTVNYRAKSRWGACRSTGLTTPYPSHRIEIASTLLANGQEHAQLDTLLHEICHSIDPHAHHGGVWFVWTQRLNRAYGFNIKNGASAEEMGIDLAKTEAKYKFECEGCGQMICRDRVSKFTKYYSLYTCGICNGKFRKL